VPPVFSRRSGWQLVPVQLVLGLLVVLITGAAVVSYDKMVTREATRQMQNTADLTEAFLNQQTIGSVAVITSVMAASNVAAALQTPDSAASISAIRQIPDILSTLGPSISSVIVMGATGKALAISPDLIPVGTDLSARPWFRQATSGGAYSISPVFESSVVKNRYVFIIAVPVRLGGTAQGRLLGVVAVAQRLSSDQQFVDAYLLTQGIRLTVLDSANAVGVQGGATSFTTATVAQRLALGRRLLQPTTHEITAVSAVSRAGSTTASVNGDWRVVSQISKSTALRPAMIFRIAAIVAGVLVLLAMLLFSWFRHRTARARQDADRHLAQSQSRIRDLADSSAELLFRMAEDGTVIFASRASESILRLPSGDLVGRDLIAMLEAEGPIDLRTRLATLIRDGEPQPFVARTAGTGGLDQAAGTHGGPRIVEGSLRLGLTDDVTEVWGALRDITDRRSARDQVEQLFELSEDFMAVVDFDGLLVQTNPVWTAAFELPPDRLLGTRFEALYREQDQERVRARLAGLALEPIVATFETSYLRAGVVRTLLWAAAPDPSRRLIYAVGRDITDHKELQRALAETRDQALEASRLKSEFVATMSHEIRTPMNGVIGLTDLLLGTRLDATQRRYVEGVRTAGDALLSVINDILDFSKIEAGRLVLDNVDFRLEDVVDDVVTLVRPAAGAKGLELTVEYESGVPFALNGDPGRLRQILLNLAHNAVKFTSQGGVSVKVEPGPIRADGQVLVIFKVIDTGIGIDRTRLEELFEPFRQADEGMARAYGGTGLGLSISRRLADLMGGDIRASSELGHGATFAAELLFAPAADWGRSVRGRDARGLGVLVVDDNEVNRLVMITQLTRWGMRPVAAASAAEAMELLTLRSAPAGGYDLAVIDMHMPETSGLALIRQLRAVPALARLPVILLTSDEAVDAAVATEHRISARLTKPVQQSALFDALTRVGLPEAAAEGEATAPTDAAAAAGGPGNRPWAEYPTDGSPGSPRSAHGRAEFQLLLVEDNDINQTVALGILSQLGYRVDVAGDGLQALTMAGQNTYDAILMDCQMPRLDGYAATIELRKRPATQRTPIIAMTAATFAVDRQRCFDSGMDDFIAKPVRAATLQATLNRWLHIDHEAGDAVPRDAGLEPLPPPPAPAARLAGSLEPPAALDPSVPDLFVAAAAMVSPAIPVQGGGGSDPSPTNADIGERITELLGEGSEVEVEMVRDIITSFLNRTVDLLQRLTLAIAADDAEAAHLHAHSLAGAGLNLGTLQVVRIAQQIEADARAGRPGLSVARLVDLEVALDQARVLLRDYAAGLPEGVK
jgi:two-component system sensor histidine kinase/response regulator